MEIEEDIFNRIVSAFNGDISNADQKALDLWRKESSVNQTLYDDVYKLWNDSKNISYLTPNQKAEDWNIINKKIAKPKSKRWYWAAACILLLLSFGTYQFYSNQTSETIYASYDSILKVQLDDGSYVEMNKESKLTVSNGFNKKNRNVALEGEAFFEVTKNEKLPFQIVSGKSRTKVIGTAFNLYSQPFKTELSVTQGRVEFGNKTESIIVTADQNATVDWRGNGVPEYSHQNLNALSWKTGILKFSNTPIQRVFTDVGKFYQTSFSLRDTSLFDLKFTSEFDHAQIDEVLQELELVLNLQIQPTDSIFLVSPNH